MVMFTSLIKFKKMDLNSNDSINKFYYESIQIISKIVNKLSDSFIELEDVLNCEETLKQKINKLNLDSNKK